MTRINNSKITEVIVTNTVPQHEKKIDCPKLKVIDISSMLAEAVRRWVKGFGEIANTPFTHM